MFDDVYPPLPLLGIVAGLCFGVCAAGMWLASARYRKLADDAHWTERARVLWPVRVAKVAGIIWVPLGVTIGTLGEFPRSGLLTVCLAGAGVLGAMLGAKLGLRGLKVPTSAWGVGFRARVSLVLLMSPSLVPVILMVAMIGHPLDTTAVAVAMGGLCFSLAWAMGVGRWMYAKLGFLRPCNERVRHLAERVSERMGVPVRNVYEIPVSSANAYAFVKTNDLAMTRGAVELLSDDEMEAVLAHEIGHLKEGSATKSKRLLALLPSCLLTLYGPVMKDWGGGAALALVALIVIMTRLMRRFQRNAERAADAVAKTDEASEGTYARALEHLYQLNLAPAVIAGATTHPNLYDRMIDAGFPPDYPRPEAAKKAPGFTWAIIMAVASGWGAKLLVEWLE